MGMNEEGGLSGRCERAEAKLYATERKLDALREELAKLEDRTAELSGEVLSLKLERNAAEQRNVELVELLREASDWLPVLRQDGGWKHSMGLSKRIDAALAKPTESGASE
jgi:chromosome segregation ATPase